MKWTIRGLPRKLGKCGKTCFDNHGVILRGSCLEMERSPWVFFWGRGARFQVLLLNRQNISAETEETEKSPIRFLRVISLSRIREIPKSDASNTNLLLLLLLLPFRHPCNCKNSCYRDRATTERISSRREKEITIKSDRHLIPPSLTSTRRNSIRGEVRARATEISSERTLKLTKSRRHLLFVGFSRVRFPAKVTTMQLFSPPLACLQNRNWTCSYACALEERERGKGKRDGAEGDLTGLFRRVPPPPPLQ